MKLDSLQTLYVSELEDLLDSESQLTKALPKMADAANSPQLRRAFEQHLNETKTQMQKVERILNRATDSPKKQSCRGMEGLIKEGNERVKASGEPAVIDASLIAAAQRVEHYEIAGYGCARTYAQMLGDDESARVLDEILHQEKAADQKLNALATEVVNLEAARA